MKDHILGLSDGTYVVSFDNLVLQTTINKYAAGRYTQEDARQVSASIREKYNEGVIDIKPTQTIVMKQDPLEDAIREALHMFVEWDGDSWSQLADIEKVLADAVGSPTKAFVKREDI